MRLICSKSDWIPRTCPENLYNSYCNALFSGLLTTATKVLPWSVEFDYIWPTFYTLVVNLHKSWFLKILPCMCVCEFCSLTHLQLADGFHQWPVWTVTTVRFLQQTVQNLGDQETVSTALKQQHYCEWCYMLTLLLMELELLLTNTNTTNMTTTA